MLYKKELHQDFRGHWFSLVSLLMHGTGHLWDTRGDPVPLFAAGDGGAVWVFYLS